MFLATSSGAGRALAPPSGLQRCWGPLPGALLVQSELGSGVASWEPSLCVCPGWGGGWVWGRDLEGSLQVSSHSLGSWRAGLSQPLSSQTRARLIVTLSLGRSWVVGLCPGLPAAPEARVTHLFTCRPPCKPISVLFVLVFVNIKKVKRIKTFLLQFPHLGCHGVEWSSGYEMLAGSRQRAAHRGCGGG